MATLSLRNLPELPANSAAPSPPPSWRDKGRARSGQRQKTRELAREPGPPSGRGRTVGCARRAGAGDAPLLHRMAGARTLRPSLRATGRATRPGTHKHHGRPLRAGWHGHGFATGEPLPVFFLRGVWPGRSCPPRRQAQHVNSSSASARDDLPIIPRMPRRQLNLRHFAHLKVLHRCPRNRESLVRPAANHCAGHVRGDSRAQGVPLSGCTPPG